MAVLDERIEEEYIKKFPLQQYQIYEVKNQGKFYIEPDVDDVVKNTLRNANGWKAFLKGKIGWEPHLLPYIEKYVRPGSVAVDVGAYIGCFTMALAKSVGNKGKVHAFEPQKKVFRELVKNAELNGVRNRIEFHRCALGDTHKTIEMMTAVEHNEAGTGFGTGGDVVEMRTLDSFNLQNVSLVKIDVEGNEDSVLDGMKKTIQNNYPIIILEIFGGKPWKTANSEERERILRTQKKLVDVGYKVDLIYWHDYIAIPE